jgi:thiosulfate dehydrogenase (quinone) large subunit
MFIAFFESIKHMGHLWPIALFRIFVGYAYLRLALEKLNAQWLQEPYLSETITQWAQNAQADLATHHFLAEWVVPYWKSFSYVIIVGEFAIAASFIVGFMVRPAALAATIGTVICLLAMGVENRAYNHIYLASSIMLFLVSAGRCAGFDYYFYKRVRGYWW